ncbi:hypothetical protein [Jeotgalibacillus salarius]|uniref:Uncharacterized protein n=1 Tax=Jeotgalibacillus salarius TaxID=546023 RepID=A0A4Y8LMJ3_9BACL|nr:hypothetical protein [Jeotgalibacillus salarius]TFE01983.1 hypothetical protein E2626_05245 [Jeotgalibacillus salarius]
MNPDFSEGNMMWIVLSVITFITGLILAFIGPNMLHYLFFSYGDVITIQTPMISNILFGAFGLLLSAFFFFMYKEGKVFKGAGFGALAVALIVLVLSVTNYSILREEKIIHNDLFSFSADEYAWSEIEGAVLLKQNEEVEHDTLILKMSNGEDLAFHRNGQMQSAFPKIDGMLQSNGIIFTFEER